MNVSYVSFSSSAIWKNEYIPSEKPGDCETHVQGTNVPPSFDRDERRPRHADLPCKLLLLIRRSARRTWGGFTFSGCGKDFASRVSLVLNRDGRYILCFTICQVYFTSARIHSSICNSESIQQDKKKRRRGIESVGRRLYRPGRSPASNGLSSGNGRFRMIQPPHSVVENIPEFSSVPDPPSSASPVSPPFPSGMLTAHRMARTLAPVHAKMSVPRHRSGSAPPPAGRHAPGRTSRPPRAGP